MKATAQRNKKYVGFRLNKNLYNSLGVLVLPSLTILTLKEVEMLAFQHIGLNDEDVEHVSILHHVNSAIQEIKGVFEKVRYSGQIPVVFVRDKIIPIIVNMSHHPDLNHILTHLEHHDEYTYRHSISVALLSRMIGKIKGYPPDELLELTIAAFLHDIGKVKVPVEIINKPDKLTPEEFNLMKHHTLYGFEMITNSVGLTHRHALVAQQHHEREDGSGYPFNLTSYDIDAHSKIVSIADVFHAMTSKRAYRDPIPFYKVLKEMSRDMYGKLEPSTTLSFLNRIMDSTIGNHVILSNGDEGKIVMIKTDDPMHPLVEVKGRFLDLSKEQAIYVERII